MHLQHTNDIQMHKCAQTNHGQEKLLCISLKIPVQCVYKNWTATESHLSPLNKLSYLPFYNNPLCSTTILLLPLGSSRVPPLTTRLPENKNLRLPNFC
jgi:hypothetical protein